MQLETKDIKNIRKVLEVVYKTGEITANVAIKSDVETFLSRLARFICSLRVESDIQGIIAESLRNRQALINQIKDNPEDKNHCYRHQLKEKIIRIWKQQ